MKTRIETKKSLDRLSYLPSFAQYLLQHRLEDLLLIQLQFSEELNLRLLQYFKGYTKEQMIELGRKGATDFLTYLANNKAKQQIEDSVKAWLSNQLPVIQKDEITAEDITAVSYYRRKTLLHFVPDYCNSVEQVVELIKELDLFFWESETALTNTYMDLLKEKIYENAHFIEKVNQTVPGAVYVFDVENFKNIYSNNKLAEVIGYSPDELNTIGADALMKLLHPAEQKIIQQQIEELKQARDGEIKVCKYRIKDKSGHYRWLANYESVFKRNEEGKVVQTIGITLDVDKEERIAADLRDKDSLYQRAEALTHLGSYTWDLKTNKLKWSDELLRMYDLEPGKDSTDFDFVSSFNYPEDLPIIRGGYTTAIREKKPFDFHYRILTQKNNHKILHARGEVITDENGEVTTVIGTVQDVTEKQNLIRKLSQSEFVYRQAEQLANMGNWTWDVKNNSIEWTDQLYRIYGLEPQSEKITIDRFLSFVHPDDREMVNKGVNEMENQDISDYIFRINTKDGKTKILRSVAQVQRDEQGKPVMVIGTERDTTDKQSLITKLQESERLYKQAQSLARLGNWSFDLKTKKFTWSDEMYKIYELSKDQMPDYRGWFDYVHPDEKEEIEKYYEECVRERKLYDKVQRILLPGGKIKTIHRKGELIFDANGNPVKMIGTTQDVTEEYRVQQELKENQTFIRKITDATPSIIASYNINTGQYVFISEGLEKLLGYDTKEVMEQGVSFFVGITHPDDFNRVMEKNAKVLEEANADPSKNDLVAEFTYRMKHKDGYYRWFHTYGTIFDRNSENKVEHVLNISLDVTDQIEATEKIKEQEHFIQQIADASPTILYLYDVDSQSMVYMNREVFFVLGYLPDEIIDEGANVTQTLYHTEDFHLLPARKESGKNFQQVDSMIQYECRLKNKDDEWKWFLVREIVFKVDENGSIKQILGAALDINRRKEMERTILQNTLQLEQSNASLEEFAYVASHDLKEPLRKISTFGDRLVATQAEKLLPEGKLYLQKIVDASQRMQTMINDLLSISMISNNTAFENYSLQTILEEAVQTLEYKIEQNNAIVTFDTLPEAQIIPSQFRQLFQNLLSNSLKFVREGIQPAIRIHCSVVDAKDLASYQLRQASKYYKIEFSDNGIGFENEFAGKIFAIFQRLHGRSEYEGSGIGLAICKKIIEHHGGIIYANGVPNEGATFTIILPA